MTYGRSVASWKGAILVLSLLAGTSCATIPSIAPFGEQTDRMVSGINGGYTASQLQLAAVSQDQAKALAKAWAPTATALTGVVAYSQALTSVATAGAEGSKAAGNLADALNGLITSFNVAAIPANLVEGFKAVNAQIAVVRAKHSLHEAVEAAEPAVNLLSNILSEQLKDLAMLLDQTSQNALLNHRASQQAMVDYVEAEQSAEARVLRILRRILDYQAKGTKANDEDLKAIRDLDPVASSSNLEVREAHWIETVKRHQAYLAAYHERYGEFVRREDELNTSRRVGAATFTKAQIAVKAWSAAHAKLKVALDKKDAPDFSAFFAAVRDVYAAFADGRALTE
jgi:hypothetical protein